MTVWKMLINLLKSPILQWWKKRKLVQNPYPGPDHHQQLINYRGSPVAHVHHVWLTSVTAIVSYPAYRTTIRLLRQNWRSNNVVLKQGRWDPKCKTNKIKTDNNQITTLSSSSSSSLFVQIKMHDAKRAHDKTWTGQQGGKNHTYCCPWIEKEKKT